MIPQGVVGLVFAVIGSTNGILDKPLEVSIIIMVILTTFLAPPFCGLPLVHPRIPIPESTTAVETASE
jgi:hypothetical protein